MSPWHESARTRAALACTLLAAMVLCACEPRGAPAARAPGGPASPATTEPRASAHVPARAPAQEAAAPPVQSETVQCGYLPILAGAPMFVAQERGYFAEQGFDLEFTPFDSGALMVAPLAAGQLDVIPAVPSPSLFNALARGVAMTAVAVQSSATTSGLVVRKELWDSGEVRSLVDLRGRRVSFNVEGSPVDYALRHGFLKYGLTLQDVEVQRLSNSDTPPALANGAVDAGIIPEPGPVLVESRGIGVRLLSSREMVGEQTGSMITFGPSMTDRGEATLVRFLAAYLKGLRETLAAMRDNHITDATVLAILSKWTNLPAETIAQAEAASVDATGRIDLDDLNRQQDFWMQEGLVPTPTDLSRFVEYRYVDAARAQLR